MRDDLPHAMRETARRLEPDVGRLTEGGVSRGTRMRRIERVVQVLGSVIAVGVVCAGVVLIGSRHGPVDGAVRPGGGTTVANQVAEASSGSPLPPSPGETPTAARETPSVTPTTTPDIPAISVNDLISALKSRLGGTDVTGIDYGGQGSDSVTPPGMSNGGGFSVHAQLSASHTAGFINIVVYGPQNIPAHAGTPRVLGDGTVAYVDQKPGTSDGHTPDMINLDVTLVRLDGSSLAAVETNARTLKGPAVPNAPLLLSADQIVTLLNSADWDPAVGAAKALPPQTPSADVAQ